MGTTTLGVLTENVRSALDYAKRGWKVFPLHYPIFDNNSLVSCSCGKKNCNTIGKHPMTPRGFKDATTDEAQIIQWWKEKPYANIGIATGPESELVVLDVDFKNEGQESLNTLVYEGNRTLPKTIISKTGNGLHYYFQHPQGHQIKNSAGTLGSGLDIRATGGYVVAPPSRHNNGKYYEWQDFADPEIATIQVLPDWLLEQILNPKKVGPVEDAEIYEEGRRNDSLFKDACKLRAQGKGFEDILDILIKKNTSRCRPRLSEKEVSNIAYSVCTYEPGISQQSYTVEDNIQNYITFALTDYGNAERLIKRHGADIRFCLDYKKWLYWDGKRWKVDNTGAIIRKAKDTVRNIYQEITSPMSPEQKKVLYKFARSSENKIKLDNFLKLAQSEKEIIIEPEEMDRKKMFFNVANGTIDLGNGNLYPHTREHHITKVSPVIYDKEADCPIFKQFLKRIFADNENLISYIKKLAGYSLTGLTTEQVVSFFYGTGSNGKSTLVNILTEVMGEYACSTPVSTFIANNQNSIRNDLARLKGMRLVQTSEFDRGQVISESLLKQLTGGEPVVARFLNAEFFEYQPEFQLFVTTNHKPQIRGTDHGIWRRIHLVPFTETIPDNERDLHFFDKLKAELPGILGWCVEGCLQWQSEGLKPPKEVLDATQEYKHDADILYDFFKERCTLAENNTVTHRELYRAFQNWAISSGFNKPLSSKKFSMLLKERGFKKLEPSRTATWSGLSLLHGNKKDS